MARALQKRLRRHRRSRPDASGPPLYARIKAALRRGILDGAYDVSQRLPSEHDLMDAYQASRVTVRRALADLQSEGLVVSRQGKGYYVARPVVVQDLRRLQGLGECAEQHGYVVRSRILSTREVEADDRVAAGLAVAQGTPVLELKRIRCLNLNPMSFDISYFPLALGRRLLECDLARTDVYPLLGRLLDDDLGHADFHISVARANPEVAHALGLEVDAPVLHVVRTATMLSGEAVDFEYLYGRPDAYQFRVRVPRW